MPSRPAVAILILALSPAITGLTVSASAELEKPVVYKVRLCEADTIEPHSGEDARRRWSDCATPLPDVPVHFKAGDARVGPVATDADGIATLGPLEGEGVTDFKIGVACTTHSCLNYDVKAERVQEGENLLLYYTIPHSPGDEDAPALPELPAGVLSAEEVAALEDLPFISTHVSLQFESASLSSLIDVLGRFASFETEYRDDVGKMQVDETLERQTVRRVLVYLANKYDLGYETNPEGLLVVSRRPGD